MPDADPVSEVDECIIGLEVPKIRERDVCPGRIIELADERLEGPIKCIVVKLKPLSAREVLVDELRRGSLAMLRAEGTNELWHLLKRLKSNREPRQISEWTISLKVEDGCPSRVFGQRLRGSDNLCVGLDDKCFQRFARPIPRIRHILGRV